MFFFKLSINVVTKFVWAFFPTIAGILNIKSFFNKNLKIFLQINEECNLKSFEKIYKNIFSNNKYELNLINNHDQKQVYENAFNIVQYGWKKEAVPIINQKKSLIGRFFDLFFN